MLTKDNVIEILQRELPGLRTEFGVKRLGVFGSFAKTEACEESDVDLVAEFEGPIGLRFIEFAERLDEILGKKTDVLTPEGIAQIRNKRIAGEIQRTIVYV